MYKSLNSSKVAKGLYEWKGLVEKNSQLRIAEGKHLKYLCSLYEKNGALDDVLKDICPCCLKQKCIDKDRDEKFTLTCLVGYINKMDKAALV